MASDRVGSWICEAFASCRDFWEVGRNVSDTKQKVMDILYIVYSIYDLSWLEWKTHTALCARRIGAVDRVQGDDYEV